jgi:N6-L-threonylcarbamoyladenine synthase
VAIVDEEQHLVADARTYLDVPTGERGLSQSEGVYQHIRNIPVLLEQVFTAKPVPLRLTAVAVSAFPRDVEGSYMPVFKVGEAVGASIATVASLPLFRTSHQNNHILAGRWSAGGPVSSEFLTLHLSGGTTELHQVSNYRNLKLLGGTKDLHAGQFVDRVGVALGLQFPAGAALEQLALQACKCEPLIPSATHAYQMSFSGPETAAQRLIKQQHAQEEIAFAVFSCIAKSVEKVLRRAIEMTGLKEILVVGGVASNNLIRTLLQRRLMHQAVGAKLYFAEPKYSRDNAVGTALYANIKHL